MKRNLKNIYFDLVKIKNILPISAKLKIIFNKFFYFFIFVDCSFMYKEGLCKFSNKNINF